MAVRSMKEGDGVAKRVYVAGSGPAVIVMPEMPGISPHVARFARRVRDAGFTVISAEFRAMAANQSRIPQASRSLPKTSRRFATGSSGRT